MMDVRDQTEAPESTPAPFASLGEAMRHVQAAEQRLRDEQHEAWKRYLDDVERILAHDLHVEADHERTDAVAHRLVGTVNSHLDDLRVHAHLGTMEAADLLAGLQHTLDQLVERVRPAGR
jgi:hypothetical protein